MNIVVVYNKELKDSQDSEDLVADDSIITAKAIAKNLQLFGHQTQLFELNKPSILKLFKLSPDLFFNQAWGVGADENSEDKVAELLEKTGVPYTGADAENIRLTGRKSLIKKLLTRQKIATPAFQLVTSKKFSLNNKLHYPLIIKPEGQDCSLGIDQGSVFTLASGLNKRIIELMTHFHESVLVEEYVAGRELNVTVLGNGPKAQVLPISEITFGPSFKNKYQVVDFAAKWEKETTDYRETVGVCPAKLSAKKAKEIKQIALKTFLLTGCRDYARVDFRLSKKGTAYVLEINTNPAIGLDDGAVRSAKAAGYSYPQFLDKIVREAVRRKKHN